MKFIILNGSPKGTLSTTMQYVRYLEKKYPDHDYEIVHVAQQIKKIEKNRELFQEIMKKVRSADGIIWGFPLYYLLVIAQYKRFIELIFEQGTEDAFNGKYTALITTSINFFDMTAHDYMEGICNDLKMHFVETFSANTFDLLNNDCRKQLDNFFTNFCYYIENKLSTRRRFVPVTASNYEYRSTVKTGNCPNSNNHKVLILTDSNNESSNLFHMVQTFAGQFNGNVSIVNINELKMSGGCQGCIRCGYDNTCLYEGRDDYIDFYRNTIEKSDIIIYAASIVDRYFSSRWKMFFDRGFFKTHTPILHGKQLAYIISGPFSQLPHMQTILDVNWQISESNFAGIVTDESDDTEIIDSLIQTLARNVVRYADMGYRKPGNFNGKGGLKIFRDDMFAELRFPFRKDYLYYKKHGYFDFPHKQRMVRLKRSFMLLLCKIPGFRKIVYQHKIKDGMVQPLLSFVESLK